MRADPPQTLSDERLAELSADGIDSAFAMLVLRHRRALVGHCAELVGHADAEEAVQEALLRAYLALARGKPVNRVGPWLRKIAHNTALNLLRARAARPTTSDDEPAGALLDSAVFERRENLRIVVAALAELPERQRQALVMRELEGRSYEEIESRLNTSNGAVRQLLNRARAAVRERLDAVAALVPAFRWVAGDGGAATTAARVGAVSGGSAVTIKVCTAALLPAVLLPGAITDKRALADHASAATPSARRNQAQVSTRRPAPAATTLFSRGGTPTLGGGQHGAVRTTALDVGRTIASGSTASSGWRVPSAFGTSTHTPRPGAPAAEKPATGGGGVRPGGTAVDGNTLAGLAPGSSAATPAGRAPTGRTNTNTPLTMGPEAPVTPRPGGASAGSAPQSSPTSGEQTSPRSFSQPTGETAGGQRVPSNTLTGLRTSNTLTGPRTP